MCRRCVKRFIPGIQYGGIVWNTGTLPSLTTVVIRGMNDPDELEVAVFDQQDDPHDLYAAAS
jgi:hypothetical protein